MEAQTKLKISDVSNQSDGEMRANNVYMAKLLLRLRVTVDRIAGGISDEGGRVYFGDTNDADELKDLAESIQAFRWEMIMDAGKARDLYAEMRIMRGALTEIDENGPTKEPSDNPTVGFRDEVLDETVDEAFAEGVVRGLWLGAKMAREALSGLGGAT